jgi:hypothetical protein
MSITGVSSKLVQIYEKTTQYASISIYKLSKERFKILIENPKRIGKVSTCVELLMWENVGWVKIEHIALGETRDVNPDLFEVEKAVNNLKELAVKFSSV